MRKMASCIVLAAVIGLAGLVSADGGMGSTFGCLTTASSLGQGRGNFGGGVGLADATSAFGTFSYGLSRYTDGRLHLGIYDADFGTKVSFGADFKWQFMSAGQGQGQPLDMGLGGLLEYIDAGGGSVLEVGAQIIGSHPYAISGGSTLTPYGRLNIRVESASASGHGSHSDLRFGLNGGVAWEATKTITLFGEVQFDGNDGLFLGVDFNVM